MDDTRDLHDMLDGQGCMIGETDLTQTEIDAMVDDFDDDERRDLGLDARPKRWTWTWDFRDAWGEIETPGGWWSGFREGFERRYPHLAGNLIDKADLAFDHALESMRRNLDRACRDLINEADDLTDQIKASRDPSSI